MPELHPGAAVPASPATSSPPRPPPPPPPRPPPRDPARPQLPTEVLLFVVDWCAELGDDRDRDQVALLGTPLRDRTLAALARTTKSLQHAAERALYATAVFSPDWGRAEVIPPGTQLYSLLQYRRLRPLVREVVVKLQTASTTTETALLLAALPNVEAIFSSSYGTLYGEPLELLLEQGLVHLRRWSLRAWPLMMRLPAWYPDAFSTFKRLDLVELWTYDEATEEPPPPSLETLTVSSIASCAPVAAFLAPLHDTLRRLDLPMSNDPHHLSPLVKLEHLSLNPALHFETAYLVRSTSTIVATLHSAAALPSLSTFEIIGTLLWKDPRDPSWSTARPSKPHQVPPCADLIVDAIPPQIVHLTLDTSALRAEHVAAWLAGPHRPPALRSLRIGNDVGRGLSAILRSRDGPHGALAQTLEEAGVDVTTVNVEDVAESDDDEDEDDE
ncbi:hypothetical protein JCM8208_005182 [Rhodotorula glutinis]